MSAPRRRQLHERSAAPLDRFGQLGVCWLAAAGWCAWRRWAALRLAARPLGALGAFGGATILGVLFLTRPARDRVPKQQGHPDILLASRRLMRGGLAVLCSIVSVGCWLCCCAQQTTISSLKTRPDKNGVYVPIGAAPGVFFRWKHISSHFG